MATAGPSLKVRIGAGIAAFALLAGVLLSFVASGSGGDADSSTSTTGSSSTTASPSTTVSPEDWDRIAAGIADVIDQAGGERCQLITAFTAFQQLPQPTTDAQVRTGIALTAQLLTAAADSAAADEVTEDGTPVGESLRTTVAALKAEAEAQAYSPDWLNTPPGATPLTSDSFAATLSAYQTRTAELCDTGATSPQPGVSTEGPVPSEPSG